MKTFRGGVMWLWRTVLPAVLLLTAGAEPVSGDATAEPVFRLAFGSCLKQDRPQPVWDGVMAAGADGFVFAGDNVYADTRDPARMRAVYQQLAAQPGYQRWRKHGPIYATWDDHDYGENDAGVEYPMKEESAAIFYDFFAVPEDSPRRSRPGIYAVHRIDAPVGRIHLILLDTRWFRGPLQRRPTRPEDRGPYVAAVDPDVPLLGEAQWMWLAEVLEEPADWRVLVSSIQIIPEEHHWEKWANLPGERERLFGLLRERRVEGVLFLSGDRHHGEISRRENPGGHPLYEVTASGMNCARRRPSSEPNRHRVGEMVAEDHFGLMVFRGRGSSAVVDLQLRDIRGHVIAGQRVRREDLTR